MCRVLTILATFVEKFNNVGCYGVCSYGKIQAVRIAAANQVGIVAGLRLDPDVGRFRVVHESLPGGTGGVYGLGIVLHALFPSIQVGTFGLMFDIPLLLIGLKVFGRMFGAKTVTAALLIPVLMNTMTYFIGENPATMFGGKMDLSPTTCSWSASSAAC